MRYASRPARRYARAVYNLAREADRLEPVLAELRAFGAKLGELPELAEFLAHRRVPAGRKLGVLADLDTGEAEARLLPADELARHFVELVIRNARVHLFGEILDALATLEDERQQVVHARVTTAVPLLRAEREQISAKIAQLAGAREVDLDCQVSRRVLGGVVIHYGGKVIDASVRTYLDTMRETLRRVRVSEFAGGEFLSLDEARLRGSVARD